MILWMEEPDAYGFIVQTADYRDCQGEGCGFSLGLAGGSEMPVKWVGQPELCGWDDV